MLEKLATKFDFAVTQTDTQTVMAVTQKATGNVREFVFCADKNADAMLNFCHSLTDDQCTAYFKQPK